MNAQISPTLLAFLQEKLAANTSNTRSSHSPERLAKYPPVFITPNTRLARHVSELLEQLRLSQQSTTGAVWPAPVVYPYERFVDTHYKRALLSGSFAPARLLTAAEEHLLWREVIRDSSQAGELLSANLAAVESQKAYALLRNWQIDIEDHRFAFESIPDSRAFYQWQQDFCLRLKTQSLICRSDIAPLLLSLNANNMSADIIPVGFQRVAPIQAKLFQHYRGDQTEPAVPVNLQVENHSVTYARAGTDDDELSAAAQWVKRIHMERPHAKIAVVVKNLAHQRLKVERVFNEALTNTCSSARSAEEKRYNLSAGIALSQTPLVATALAILQSTQQALPVADWRKLLCSPFLFDQASDLAALSSLCAAMYHGGEADYRLQDLAALFEWSMRRNEGKADEALSGHRRVPAPIQKLSQVVLLWHNMPHSDVALPTRWIDGLWQIATTLGWPGSRTLDSEEYQQRMKLEQAINEFSRYDSLVGEVTEGRAVALFSEHISNTIFHSETDANKNVPQVLGLFEAAGMVFDHLWVVGMSDREWPGPARPSPMLPLSLQIDQSMPSCSAQSEYDYARSLISGFANSATEVVLSYSGDGESPPRLASIVAQICQPFTVNQIDLTVDATACAEQLLFERCPFEWVADDHGTAYGTAKTSQTMPGEPLLTPLKGGISALKDMAINPLQAYIRHRLRADPLPMLVSGVSPMERGNLIHQSLELIWRELQEATTLHSLSNEKLQALVVQSTEKSARSIFAPRFKPLGTNLQMIEKKVAASTLYHWLQFEKQRPDFSIEHLEHSIEFTSNAWKIAGRVDRIDRLGDGSLLLIDYKTGAIRGRSLVELPLCEPQLPIYILSLQNDMSDDGANIAQDSNHRDRYALALACLKPGGFSFQGYVQEDDSADSHAGDIGIAGIQLCTREALTWQALCAQWRGEIDQLLCRFVDGYAGCDLELHGFSESYEPFTRFGFAQVQATLPTDT